MITLVSSTFDLAPSVLLLVVNLPKLSKTLEKSNFDPRATLTPKYPKNRYNTTPNALLMISKGIKFLVKPLIIKATKKPEISPTNPTITCSAGSFVISLSIYFANLSP